MSVGAFEFAPPAPVNSGKDQPRAIGVPRYQWARIGDARS
jgi:hypothetical protein